MTRPKNKTLATWSPSLAGRWACTAYLMLGDPLGWMLPIPTALGLYGVERVQRFGQDDQWSLAADSGCWASPSPPAR